MAANGAQYGVATVNYYWIGAIPAMVFLGLVMMPFYYGSKVRSVPEYLRLRFNNPSHMFNSSTFALATILIAGVNLYALALVLKFLLGWPILLGIVVAAVIVLVYITLGGLSLGDLQRGAAVLRDPRGADPDLDRRPARRRRLERPAGQVQADQARRGRAARAAGHGARQRDQPDRRRPGSGIVFGLGFVLSFGYWTTNFAEVQRALSAQEPVGRPAHAADRRVPEARSSRSS